MTTHIRRFDPDRDIEGVRRCFVELQDHEHAFEPEAPTGAELVDEYVPFMIERCARPGGAIFVAELDGRVVGFAALLRVERPEPDDTEPFHIELAELSVLSEARGHRVGSALMEQAERHARAQDSPSLRIRVHAANPDARRLYERQGFSPSVITLWKGLRESPGTDATGEHAISGPPWTGGCLCGAFRFEITIAPKWVGYCHCRMCQKASGAPVVAWATVPRAGFVPTSGELRTRVSSPKARRGFCPACGGALTFELVAPTDDIDVAVAALDEPSRFPPAFHIWTSSRLQWFDTTDPLPRHPQEPPR